MVGAPPHPWKPHPLLLGRVVKDHGVITCLLKAEVEHDFVTVRLSYNVI